MSFVAFGWARLVHPDIVVRRLGKTSSVIGPLLGGSTHKGGFSWRNPLGNHVRKGYHGGRCIFCKVMKLGTGVKMKPFWYDNRYFSPCITLSLLLFSLLLFLGFGLRGSSQSKPAKCFTSGPAPADQLPGGGGAVYGAGGSGKPDLSDPGCWF